MTVGAPAQSLSRQGTRPKCWRYVPNTPQPPCCSMELVPGRSSEHDDSFPARDYDDVRTKYDHRRSPQIGRAHV